MPRLSRSHVNRTFQTVLIEVVFVHSCKGGEEGVVGRVISTARDVKTSDERHQTFLLLIVRVFSITNHRLLMMTKIPPIYMKRGKFFYLYLSSNTCVPVAGVVDGVSKEVGSVFLPEYGQHVHVCVCKEVTCRLIERSHQATRKYVIRRLLVPNHPQYLDPFFRLKPT